MGRILYTGDNHFGHGSSIKFDNRPWSSVEEMDREMILRWNKKVNKDDTVYIAGDFSWYNAEKTEELLKQLKGKKVLIRGNHDRNSFAQINELDEFVDSKEVHYADNTHVVIQHYPSLFYNRQHYGAVLLYAHTHTSLQDAWVQVLQGVLLTTGDPCEMYNVGCMHWDYEPVTLEEIRGRYKSKTPEKAIEVVYKCISNCISESDYVNACKVNSELVEGYYQGVRQEQELFVKSMELDHNSLNCSKCGTKLLSTGECPDLECFVNSKL